MKAFTKESLIAKLRTTTQEKLSEELGISSATLRRMIKSFGIRRREYSVKETPKAVDVLIERNSKEEILACLRVSGGIKGAAKKLETSAATLKRAMRRLGITQRDYPNPAAGKPAWNSGKGHSTPCEVCGVPIHAPKTKKRRFCSRECMHAAWSLGLLKPSAMNLQTFTKGKKIRHAGVVFRSSWEAEFAKELDAKGLEWQYEKHRFTLSNGKVYVPDFYVPEKEVFYEVKGYWWPKAKKKFDLFLKEHPHIDIEVKGEDWWNARQTCLKE